MTLDDVYFSPAKPIIPSMPMPTLLSTPPQFRYYDIPRYTLDGVETLTCTPEGEWGGEVAGEWGGEVAGEWDGQVPTCSLAEEVIVFNASNIFALELNNNKIPIARSQVST